MILTMHRAKGRFSVLLCSLALAIFLLISYTNRNLWYTNVQYTNRNLWYTNVQYTNRNVPSTTRDVSYKMTTTRPPAGSTVHAPHCYKLRQTDENVADISDYNVKRNSIFFIETSCRHLPDIRLTTRQACAYESAARIHPHSEVLVLIPAPISLENAPPLISQLSKYPNLKILHVDVARYFINTPLQDFNFVERMKASSNPKPHASDVLRLLTLWKYGGTYLDSDFVVIKPVNEVENYVAAESVDYISNGVLNFNESGRRVAEGTLKELHDTFVPKAWGHNGPGVITRVFTKLCNESDTRKMTREKCGGFTVYPSDSDSSPFYPVPWYNLPEYFKQNPDQKLIDKLDKAIALHMASSQSFATPVKTGSPYAIFAARYCPNVYSTAVDYF